MIKTLLDPNRPKGRFFYCLMAVPELFNSPRLLRELRTFVRHGDGSGSAAAGTHDDCVMAMGIGLLVREQLAGSKPGAVDWGSLPADTV